MDCLVFFGHCLELENFTENFRGSRVVGRHACKKPHLSLIDRLDKEQRQREALNHSYISRLSTLLHVFIVLQLLVVYLDKCLNYWVAKTARSLTCILKLVCVFKLRLADYPDYCMGMCLVFLRQGHICRLEMHRDKIAIDDLNLRKRVRVFPKIRTQMHSHPVHTLVLTNKVYTFSSHLYGHMVVWARNKIIIIIVQHMNKLS